MTIRECLVVSIQAGGMGSGCRGPNCGRKVVSFYHGTSRASAKSIKKQGIMPGDIEKGSTGKVYLAATPHEALEYAGNRGSLIRVEIPASQRSRVRWYNGDEDGTDGAYRHNGPIPAKYIKDIVDSKTSNADKLDKKYRDTQLDSDMEDDDDDYDY